MLSDRERQIWDEIERHYENDTGLLRDLDDLPTPFVAGIWLTIALVLVGVTPAALAVGGLTGLGWLVWRYRSTAAPRTRRVRRPSIDFRGPESAWTNAGLPLSAALDPARWSGSRDGERPRRDG